LQEGTFAEAAIAYERSIVLNPNFSWAHHYLGDLAGEIEEHGKSATTYRQAIELNPDFCWTYSSLGDVLMELSECEAAVAYRKVIELNPDFLTVYHMELGKALIASRNWEKRRWLIAKLCIKSR
jgi:tetratricopeptide (TPR) repeat protein